MSPPHEDKTNGVGKTYPAANNKVEERFKLISALTSPVGSLVLLFTCLLIGAAFNYFGSNPRILYLPIIGVCLVIFFLGHRYVQSEIVRLEAAKKESHRAPEFRTPGPTSENAQGGERVQPKEHTTKPKLGAPKPKPQPENPTPVPPPPRTEEYGPLRIMTDAQCDVLRGKLRAHSGSSVRLVLVGGDPQLGTAYGQLVRVFNEAGWAVQQTRIGMAAVMGVAFPNGPYMTGSNIASPLITDVFAEFSSVGINLPLAPNAFTAPGPRAPVPDVVIVVH